jgi:hypothetical protein
MPKIQLGFRSSRPINHPSLCIVFSVYIVEFVSTSACQVAGLSVCSIRVSSSNHHSHAATARLHHRSTISFHHHTIYFHHRLHIRFCSFLPISFVPFSESVSKVSVARQEEEEEQKKAKKKVKSSSKSG